MSKHQYFHVPVQLAAVSLVVFAVHLARSILPEPARPAYPQALASILPAANGGQGPGLVRLRQNQSQGSAGHNLGLAARSRRKACFSTRGGPEPAVLNSPCPL